MALTGHFTRTAEKRAPLHDTPSILHPWICLTALPILDCPLGTLSCTAQKIKICSPAFVHCLPSPIYSARAHSLHLFLRLLGEQSQGEGVSSLTSVANISPIPTAVPTCHLDQLAERLDAVNSKIRTKQVLATGQSPGTKFLILNS